MNACLVSKMLLLVTKKKQLIMRQPLTILTNQTDAVAPDAGDTNTPSGSGREIAGLFENSVIKTHF
jgi:hypothetical protein